ncbi:MAG: STAS domain-containing protein, partial [Spartobacteria bacterium]
SSSILVGSENRTVWMKLEGRGTFENSKCVKEFVQRMISKGHNDFVLDLEKCELMDSTFMGTLASVAFSLRDLESGLLRVVRANARNFSLLEGLGLDHLFQVEPEPSPSLPPALHKAGIPGSAPDEQRLAILEAHEALIDADPRNAVRFQDVIEYLRQEIAEGGPAGSH